MHHIITESGYIFCGDYDIFFDYFFIDAYSWHMLKHKQYTYR